QARGGRERPNNLCIAFAALVGAVYHVHGLDATPASVVPLLDRQLELVLAQHLDKDARLLPQERRQATNHVTPIYRTVSETGPDHEKVFTVEVLVGSEVVGLGTGRSKQAAAQAAAQDALKRIQT